MDKRSIIKRIELPKILLFLVLAALGMVYVRFIWLKIELEQTRYNYETFFNTIDDFLFVLDDRGNIIHTNATVSKRLECLELVGLFPADQIRIGDELCLLFFMVDITSRKMAEEEIRKARNEADKANFAKSEFLSRIEAGKILVSPEPVEHRNVILEMAPSFADSFFVMADRQLIKQVLLNILNNAIKYNREGGIVSIKTELMPMNSVGIVPVRISISDTGEGISSGDIQKLIIAFERIGGRKNKGYSGHRCKRRCDAGADCEVDESRRHELFDKAA